MRVLLRLVVVPAILSACAPPLAPLAVPTPVAAEVEAGIDLHAGRALFVHNWTVQDDASVAGDGLGPFYNATSCVACHAQGGIGGAGGAHRNALGTARHALPDAQAITLGLSGIGGSISQVFGPAPAAGPRNTTALFGAGLIDAIGDDVIEALGDSPQPSGIHGRVARTPDGRVARFGWKGDVANLFEFVSRACAVEIGLEVPGVAQEGAPARGLDLDLDDVEALTGFVAALPAPERAPNALMARAGERIFDEIGCSGCHRARVGDVEGIYSDLLLHDLGSILSDAAGSWGAPVSNTMATVWRTPPLWGVRDSGPWLHDGRAQTLEMAVLQHGGEAHRSRTAWRALAEIDRLAVIAFLETLVAPGAS